MNIETAKQWAKKRWDWILLGVGLGLTVIYLGWTWFSPSAQLARAEKHQEELAKQSKKFDERQAEIRKQDERLQQAVRDGARWKEIESHCAWVENQLLQINTQQPTANDQLILLRLQRDPLYGECMAHLRK